MCGRSLFMLGMFAGVWTPTAAETIAVSYTLEELRVVARATYPTLDSADAGVELAAGALRQARAHPNPTFTAAAGRGRPRDGGDSRSEVSFEFAQPIELPGVRRWRARVAELGVRGAEFERSVAESLVDSAVARLAYSVMEAAHRVDIAHESARVAGRLHELLARRVEVGESPPLEAVRALTEWFARRRDLLQAEGELAAARTVLNLFCGERLGAGYELVDLVDRSGAGDLPADLVDRLRARNPILLRAGVSIEEAGAGVETARQEAAPRLEIFAGHATELDRTATSVGAGLTIPLWNRNRGAIQSAAAHRRRAASDASALSLELETELGRAVAEYTRSLGLTRLHAEGWSAAAQQALDIATFSFENGEASLLDVLDAQRAYLEVRLAEANSRAALNLARTEIERLIGGPLADGVDP